MRLLFAITLPGICAVFAFGQSIELGTSAFENDRFEIEATSDTDALLILERFDSNNLDSPSTTPVDMALGQASIPQNLTEYLASAEAKGFFLITGRDLVTFEDDTDEDGIKDRIELQAGEFIHPLDGSDAAQADLFSVVPDVSLSVGVPGAGAGAIESPHYIDLYHFDGTAGIGLFVDAVAFDSELFLHQYQIIDPYGNVVKASGFGFADIGPISLPYDGGYLLLVGDKIRTGTGEYAISLTEIPAPQSFNISIGDTILVDVPAVGAGRIEAPGAFDSYFFTATANDKVFLNTLSFSGVATIAFRVFDPDGNELDEQQFNLGDMGTVDLPSSGIYRIEVGAINNDDSGTYSIALTAIPEPDEFAINIGDSISDGIPGPGAGNIEAPGVFDRYTFAGTEGQTIFIDRVSFSGGSGGVSSIDYKLFDPLGNEIASRQFNTGDIADVELPATGIYTLEVGESSDDGSGTYEIAIYDIPAADEFAINIGDSISEGSPGPGAGTIETPGVFDRYTFAGTEGQTIFIDRVSSSGVNTVDYKLLDPSGAEVAAKQFNLGDIATIELPSTGTYTLEVGEADNDSTGVYAITLYAIPSPDEFAISIGDSISENVPGPGAGTIETPGSFDRYLFTGTTGQSIFIDRGSISGVNTVDYKLYDPLGAEIATTQFNLGALGTVDLLSTGTYTLEVGEPSNDATGTYAISLTDIPAPYQSTISYGEAISPANPGGGSGNIEVPGAYDRYAFAGTAGDLVEVEVASQDGLNSLNFQLLDPSGIQLATRAFFQGSLGPIELPETGTYTLEVGEADNPSTGIYSIVLDLSGYASSL